MADSEQTGTSKGSPKSGPKGGESYRVLARKYRPQNFDDLIGQEAMVTTLTNAFKTGRIAQAYMLTGVRGVGKTTTARILARALNYQKGDIDRPTIDLAEEGEHCRAIMEGRHVDVIEMDAASHTGIDNIRDIIESVQYAPAIARYKVYIIDEVHQLSNHSFNALLKTLEEPPAHLKFIFATTEIRKVPVTVLSRCQRFDLRRIEAGVLTEHLAGIIRQEGVEADDEALALVARAAEGSVRDALSILDQAIAHSPGRIEAAGVRAMLGLADKARIIDLFEQVMRGDIAAALAELKEQYDLGADPSVVMTDLADFVHYVTRLKYVPEAADDASLTEAERKRGVEFARDLSVRVLGRAWQILLKGIAEIEASERPLPAADMVLVRLTHASSLPAPDEVLRSLQEGGKDGVAAAPPPNGGSAGNGYGQRQSAPVAAAPVASAAAPKMGAAPTSGKSPRATGSPATMAAPQAVPRSTPEPESRPEPIAVNSFEELILLAEDKRDIRIRTALRRNVRLINFADGRLEFELAGSPPPTFVQDLSARLAEWTGRRWIIATSREGGAPTLEEIEQAEMNERTELAQSDPAVAAILSRFPGSRIIDVRLREAEDEAGTGLDIPEDPEAEAEREADEEPGLDDFFE